MEEQNRCQCFKLINKLLKKVEKLETKEKIKDETNDFEIDTFAKASKKLLCSVSTLRKAVEEDVLKEDIHYRFNGRRKYLFSTSALLKIKGTL